MSSVTFRGVTKRFGTVTALHELDLDVDDGSFVSLLGPSGSGKSTTLNLLAGLLPMDEGEIRIGTRRVNDVSPDARDIAMVFQNYALYPHMTVYENLAFPLRARGRRVAREKIDAVIKDVSEMLGVFMLLDRYPRELSGGQQQRVALGRAMVRDPEVFLLDEPLSNLDARLRIRMRSDIRALHRRLNATIVYVTHDQAEAMTLSDKVAVFSQGRLQQYGTPADVYNRPANLFVANFLGEREMNTFRAQLHQEGGRLSLRRQGIDIALDGTAPRLSRLAGREIVCGVRLEAVKIRPAGPDASVRGTVAHTELSGPDLVLSVDVADDLTLWCRTEPTRQFREGEAVALTLPVEQLHYFDPVTEQTLRAHI